ncbi:hypothetical protein ACFXTH_015031 [Malus domestica]
MFQFYLSVIHDLTTFDAANRTTCSKCLLLSLYILFFTAYFSRQDHEITINATRPSLTSPLIHSCKNLSPSPISDNCDTSGGCKLQRLALFPSTTPSPPPSPSLRRLPPPPISKLTTSVEFRSTADASAFEIPTFAHLQPEIEKIARF